MFCRSRRSREVLWQSIKGSVTAYQRVLRLIMFVKVVRLVDKSSSNNYITFPYKSIDKRGVFKKHCKQRADKDWIVKSRLEESNLMKSGPKDRSSEFTRACKNNLSVVLLF